VTKVEETLPPDAPPRNSNSCLYNNWKRLLLRFAWTMPWGLVSSVLRHFYIKVAC